MRGLVLVLESLRTVEVRWNVEVMVGLWEK